MAATQPEETATRLERLERLRDSLEARLDGGEVAVRDYAALSREYRATLVEIEALQPRQAEGDGIDEITRRRAARRSGPPKGSARADRSG